MKRRWMVAAVMMVALVYGATLVKASRAKPEPFVIEISVVEQANTCRPRAISGTGSGRSFGVYDNLELASEHTTARGGLRAAEAIVGDDSLAQVVLVEYLWLIFQDNQGNNCAPRSRRPPWPLALRAAPPPLDSVVVVPDSASMVVTEQTRFASVLWKDGQPWVCHQYGPLWEAKIAEDRSRVCAVSDGARFQLCDTPQPVLEITSAQGCPSAGE